MITAIELTNFQSHKSSRIELCSGINVLCGESDHGKTSFIRALRWVAENRPSGDRFRSHFAEKEDTVVRVEFQDGWVERRKGNSTNSYLLSTAEGEQEFKAMGQGVPAEIAAFLRLRPINFQYQMDGPFLLSSSSSEVAQYLNKEARIDVIDRATAAIRKKILNNNTALTYNKQDVEKHEKNLMQYEGLDEMELLIQKGETCSNSLSKVQKHLSSLRLLSQKKKEAEAEMTKWCSLLEGTNELVGEISKQMERGKVLHRQYCILSTLQQDVLRTQKKLNQYTKILSLGSMFDEIEVLQKQIGKIKNQHKSLADIQSSLKRYQQEAAKYGEAETRAGKAYQEASKNRCPTCGALRNTGRS